MAGVNWNEILVVGLLALCVLGAVLLPLALASLMMRPPQRSDHAT